MVKSPDYMEMREQLIRYRWMAILSLLAILFSGVVVLVLALTIRSAKARVNNLEVTAQSLTKQLQKIAVLAEVTERRLGNIQDDATSTMNIISPGRLYALTELERCDFDKLPKPTEDFDPLVIRYVNGGAFSFLNLKTSDNTTKRIESVAWQWVEVRPESSYRKVYGELYSSDDLAAKLQRFWIERQAVVIACLRQAR
jgi:hypothetical protein